MHSNFNRIFVIEKLNETFTNMVYIDMQSNLEMFYLAIPGKISGFNRMSFNC